MPWDDVVANARKKRSGYVVAEDQSAPPPAYAGAGGSYGDVASVQGAQDSRINSDLNYDASAALDKYARGAFGSVSAGLAAQQEKLRGASVGAGRFDSGYFDRDTGEVTRNVMNDFTNNLSQQALGAEHLTQDVRGRGTDLLLGRSEQVQNDAREEAARRRQKRSGIGSAIGSVLGGAGGAFLGGPWGASIGAQLGGSVGGAW